MDVHPNSVFFEGATFTEETRRILRQGVGLMATYEVVATTRTSVPLSSLDMDYATAVYNSFTSLLAGSVASGIFAIELDVAVESVDATSLESATIASITSSELIYIDNTSTGNSKGDSDSGSGSGNGFPWEFLAIIAGGAIAVLIVIIVCCYCYFKNSGTNNVEPRSTVDVTVVEERDVEKINL